MWYWVTFLSPSYSVDAQWVWAHECVDEDTWRCHALVVAPSEGRAIVMLSSVHPLESVESVVSHPNKTPDYGGKIGRAPGWDTPPRYWIGVMR